MLSIVSARSIRRNWVNLFQPCCLKWPYRAGYKMVWAANLGTLHAIKVIFPFRVFTPAISVDPLADTSKAITLCDPTTKSPPQGSRTLFTFRKCAKTPRNLFTHLSKSWNKQWRLAINASSWSLRTREEEERREREFRERENPRWRGAVLRYKSKIIDHDWMCWTVRREWTVHDTKCLHL